MQEADGASSFTTTAIRALVGVGYGRPARRFSALLSGKLGMVDDYRLLIVQLSTMNAYMVQLVPKEKW